MQNRLAIGQGVKILDQKNRGGGVKIKRLQHSTHLCDKRSSATFLCCYVNCICRTRSAFDKLRKGSTINWNVFKGGARF